MDLGSVLESKLGQKWRYGALKAIILVSSEKIHGLKGFANLELKASEPEWSNQRQEDSNS